MLLSCKQEFSFTSRLPYMYVAVATTSKGNKKKQGCGKYVQVDSSPQTGCLPFFVIYRDKRGTWKPCEFFLNMEYAQTTE